MIQLSCQNEFCIYQKQGTCILDRIELDMRGNCVDCIWLNIGKETVDDLKDKLLTELEKTEQ